MGAPVGRVGLVDLPPIEKKVGSVAEMPTQRSLIIPEAPPVWRRQCQ
ncbi:MAG TPA: hypothetical protein VF160_03330 [Candidatus Dormibacteraeota bacterium]